MLVNNFSNGLVSGQVHCDNGVFTVTGRLSPGFINRSTVHYRASEPQDKRLSISGSALPFPGVTVAFGPINSGQAEVSNYGSFKFQVFSPNSYYANDDIMNGVGQGKILVLPEIMISVLHNNGKRADLHVKLPNANVPLRSLTNFPGKHVRSTGRNTPSYIV